MTKRMNKKRMVRRIQTRNKNNNRPHKKKECEVKKVRRAKKSATRNYSAAINVTS